MKRVVFLVDGLRTDLLSCYNHDTTPTPNIDAIASTGVKFDNFIVHAPETYPSIGTLFTGKYPHKHGIGYKKIAPDDVKCIVDYMPETRMSVGLFSPFGGSVSSKYFYDTWGWVHDLRKQLSYNPNVDELCKRIDTLGDDYFLYVYFWTTRDIQNYLGEAPHKLSESGRTEELLAAFRTLVGRVDKCVGKVMQHVGTIDDDDLVMFTADHGESIKLHEGRRLLCETVDDKEGNAWMEHNSCRFDSAIRVPMLMSGSRIKPNSRVRTQVRQIDFAPTVLSLLHTGEEYKCDGSSIAEHLVDGTEPPEKPVTVSKTSCSRMQAIRYKGWKLIFDDTGMALYNLIADPGELNNIANGNREQIEYLLSKVPKNFDDTIVTTEDILRRYTRFKCDRLDVVAKAFANLGVTDKWAWEADKFDNKIAWSDNPEYAKALSDEVVGCEKVLDVGCGTGMFMKHAKKRFGDAIEVHGIDSSPAMLEHAKKHGTCRFGVADNMSYKDNMFDCVVCRMLLHHVPTKIDNVLREAKRVLKPGGKLIVCEQLAPADELTNEYIDILKGRDKRRKNVMVVVPDKWKAYVEKSGFNITSNKCIWLRQVSLDDILDYGCKDRCVRRYSKIKNNQSSKAFKKASNFTRLKNGDILMDLRHALIVGVKNG